MRSRILVFALVLGIGSLLLPYAAHAATIPFFGPIIPPENPTCPANWKMLIVVINNIIRFLITLAIVFVAPLMIAYAGFLFVVNPVNASGIGQAKTILKNTIIGIVLALSGYLIVGALMAVLYNGSFGSWSEIIDWSGDVCLPQAGVTAGVTPGSDVTVVLPGGTLVGVTAFGCKNAASCQVSASINAKLDQMKSNLGTAASQYQITETGVNTTVTHASGANNLDMSCYGPCSPTQVKAAIAAWPGSVKYETSSQSDYSAMIAAGVPAGNILGPSWFTGTFSNGVCSTGAGHCLTGTHMSLNP